MNGSRYLTYREVGSNWLPSVPSHWEVDSARRLFAQRREASLPGDAQLSATQKYGVIPQSQFIANEVQKVVLALSGTEKFRHVEPDDFVISLRSFQGGIERSRYAGCVSPAYTVLRLCDGQSPDYWEYLLKSSAFISALQTTADGIRDGKNIGYTQFGSLPLPVAPFAEQQSIAAFLRDETAKIDALVTEQERLITLLAEKRQSIIAGAVTRGLNSSAPMKDPGVPWIGKVPAHWQVGALKRFWTVTDCKHVTADFVDDGIPLASIREVQSRYVELNNAKKTTRHFYEQLTEGGRKPRTGDLIFSRNATVGEVAQVAEGQPEFAMGQDVCLLRKVMPGLSTDFLQAVIRSRVVVEQLKNLMIGSTFKRVNVEEIRGLVVTMPPSEEQAEIADFIIEETEKLDRLQHTALTGITLLEERRSALITAAVTGQIDVRGQVPATLPEPAAVAA